MRWDVPTTLRAIELAQSSVGHHDQARRTQNKCSEENKEVGHEPKRVPASYYQHEVTKQKEQGGFYQSATPEMLYRFELTHSLLNAKRRTPGITRRADNVELRASRGWN